MLLLIIVIGGLSWYVQYSLKQKFKKYSKITLQNNLSGKEIAEQMLADNNIYDVKVISTAGQLTDHYDPRNKTVNLSNDVYNGTSISSAAVAAHECGHAVQHAKSYAWLNLRTQLVPTINIASKYGSFLLIGGILFFNTFPYLLLIGIVLFAANVLFSFITLPVEYDASNRALVWLNTKNFLSPQEHKGAQDALKWAARTYVVAAIGALATLLYYLSIFNRR
ncbi:MAG: zinc metallopeptidase [Flavobacteriaceae bacterium]|nr:zinc metallopeptidase [Flavobacteriaceae bacterium]